MQPRSRRLLASLIALGVSAAGLSVAAPAQAEEGPWPGLPKIFQPSNYPDQGDLNTYGWLNAPDNGLSASTRARQWARVPLGVLATNISFLTDYPGGQNPGDLFGEDRFDFKAFFVSPEGSRHAYGDSQLIPVRSVAFGAIPVEATLQVQQARDADDLPVPFHLEARTRYIKTADPRNASGDMYVDPTALKATVSVRVAKLVVDGVDVGIGANCSTGATAQLDAESRAWKFAPTDPTDPKANDPLRFYDPRTAAYGLQGGTFYGTIEIPRFSGCTTAAGDDVSPVLTSTLSGPGNPVAVQYGVAACFPSAGFGPPPPGADTPAKAGCQQFQLNPDNPKLLAIPRPWEIPTNTPPNADVWDGPLNPTP